MLDELTQPSDFIKEALEVKMEVESPMKMSPEDALIQLDKLKKSFPDTNEEAGDFTEPEEKEEPILEAKELEFRLTGELEPHSKFIADYLAEKFDELEVWGEDKKLSPEAFQHAQKLLDEINQEGMDLKEMKRKLFYVASEVSMLLTAKKD